VRLEGCFINLDGAVERRRNMESQLARSDLAGAVHRLPALEGDGRAQALSPPELGCFLSHERAILPEAKAPFRLVLEDDVLIPPNLGARLAALLPRLPGEWDLLLLNMMVNVRRGTQVRTLMRLWKTLEAAPGERYEMLDAATYFCWLAAAYVVPPRSRLRALLAGAHGWQKPFDVQVRDWLQQGHLKGYVVFPYLVGIDPGPPSQLGRAADSQAMHAAATNLFWRDADLDQCEQLTSGLVPGVDADCRALVASRLFYKSIR
jgi:GR25 family glycosyltransferase involved in LPS biosynthesis